MRYTKIKTFRTTEIQYKTLQKMKIYNVDVGGFIREAIKEKLEKEKKHFLTKKSKTNFERQLSSLLKN